VCNIDTCGTLPLGKGLLPHNSNKYSIEVVYLGYTAAASRRMSAVCDETFLLIGGV
jgi:hypothetical protein